MRLFRCSERLASTGNLLRQGLSGCLCERALRSLRVVCRRPAFFADQRHEANVGQILTLIFILRDTGNADELLHLGITTRGHHQPATDLELFFQRFRNRGLTGGDDDSIIRRMLGPAFATIAVQDVVVVVAEISKSGSRLLR